MTQEDLAQAAGITVRTVGNLERELTTAHPSTIKKLASALGVEPQHLVKTGGDE